MNPQGHQGSIAEGALQLNSNPKQTQIGRLQSSEHPRPQQFEARVLSSVVQRHMLGYSEIKADPQITSRGKALPNGLDPQIPQVFADYEEICDLGGARSTINSRNLRVPAKSADQVVFVG
jgi:hypothetical protein